MAGYRDEQIDRYDIDYLFISLRLCVLICLFLRLWDGLGLARWDGRIERLHTFLIVSLDSLKYIIIAHYISYFTLHSIMVIQI